MKKKLALCLSICLLTLCSCSKKEVTLDDYVSTVKMKQKSSSDPSLGYSQFKILQLTDIHWTLITDTAFEKKYISTLVKNVNPDMLMITGDSFLIGDKQLVLNFFEFIDSLNIPYATTWGNHDEEGDYTKEFLSKQASVGKNSLYKHVNDNIYGDSNYVINLKKGDSTILQIYSLDSHSSYYDKTYGYKYDYIRDDQVNWYVSEAEKAKESNSGSYVPSLFYYHIPIWEAALSYYQNGMTGSGYVMGDIKESSTYSVHGLTDVEDRSEISMWPQFKHSTLFDEAKKRNAKAMFTGHDHSNTYVSKYENVYLGYGVKTGQGLYYYGIKDGAEYDHTGGSLIYVNEDGSLELKHVFLDVSSVKDGRNIIHCDPIDSTYKMI